MSVDYSSAVTTARDYYDSEDADNYYFTIWGGEDIHIGLYRSQDDDIMEASRRTVQWMAFHILPLNNKTRVLDIGAGYGGAARFLARTYGCHVTALNLSEVENQRNRKNNKAQGLDHLIEVVDGSFEDIPYPAHSFDLVWSQDAILHSGNRAGVLEEVMRVLRPNGDFIFTDPMQSDTCPEGVLQPILDRIHLDTLASPEFYCKTAHRLGMELIKIDILTPHLVTHYTRVLEETDRREKDLATVVNQAYIDRMKRGLEYWIEGGRKGDLMWGVMHFTKP